MVGELRGGAATVSPGRVPSGRLGQPVSNGVVKASPLAGQQVGVDDLRQQRVAEAIGAGVVVDLEDVAGDRLANRLDQLALRQLRHRGEEALVSSRAGDGDRAEDPLGRIGQLRNAADEDVAERARDRTGPSVDADAARLARDDLLGEERIALRAGMNALDHATPQAVTEDRGELLTLLREIERPQIQALDARGSGRSRRA